MSTSNVLNGIRAVLRAILHTELEPLENSFPRVLPRDPRTPLVLTLWEDVLQCEQALLWFDPASQAIAPSSRVHHMALDCLTVTAASTIRRLVPEALEKLLLQTQDAPSSESLGLFFRAAAECVNKDRLRELAISDHSESQHSKPPKSAGGHAHGTGMDPCLFDQHLTFGPLVWGVWNLRTLELELEDVLEFTDAFVERLADACPQVTHLRLCGPPFEKRAAPLERAPCMTLGALEILAERCPELSELQIELDGTRLPDAHAHAHGGPRKHGLIELGVGMSPVGRPEKVAALIMRCFPDLFQLSWYEGPWVEEGIESAEMDRVIGWACVEERMGLWSWQLREQLARWPAGVV